MNLWYLHRGCCDPNQRYRFISWFVAISLHAATKQLSPSPFVGDTNGPEAEPHHGHAASSGFPSAGGSGQQQIISERQQQQRRFRALPPQQHPAHLRAADSTRKKRRRRILMWCESGLGSSCFSPLNGTECWEPGRNEVHQPTKKSCNCCIYTTGLKDALLKLPTVAKGLPGCLPPGKTSGSSMLILFLNKWSQLVISQKDQNDVKTGKMARI